MNKKHLQWGCVFALIAVILGAFGAHGLANQLEEKQLTTYQTGVDYQFIHSIALLITGVISQHFNSKRLLSAGWLFILGVFCFSGSLYLLACRDLIGLSASFVKIIGPVTPLGGLFFIGGWLMLFLGISEKDPSLPIT